MVKVLTSVKRFLKQITGFLPQALPTGMAEFDAFIDDLMTTYWMPTTSKDDIIFVVTSTIIRFPEAAIARSKWYFAKIIRAAATKQIAGANFQEVKLRSQKQQAEATAAKAASDDTAKTS